jgi:hypothetical protein
VAGGSLKNHAPAGRIFLSPLRDAIGSGSLDVEEKSRIIEYSRIAITTPPMEGWTSEQTTNSKNFWSERLGQCYSSTSNVTTRN